MTKLNSKQKKAFLQSSLDMERSLLDLFEMMLKVNMLQDPSIIEDTKRKIAKIEAQIAELK
jgi:hypothetical protein